MPRKTTTISDRTSTEAAEMRKKFECTIEDLFIYEVSYDNSFYKMKPYSKKAIYREKRETRFVSSYDAVLFFSAHEKNVTYRQVIIWGVEPRKEEA
jgi:hypothetical protein